MRLATATHDAPAIPAPFLFGFLGLGSGLICWLLGEMLNPEWSKFGGISPVPGLVFALALAAAAWLSGAVRDEEVGPASWLAAFLAVPAWYWVVVKLLFAGYFSQLFDMPGWLNFALCGAIGAVGIGVIASFFVRKNPGWTFAALPIAGLICGFSGESGFFLFPWWQGSVAILIGLWVARD
jgi:hypothetical protein